MIQRNVHIKLDNLRKGFERGEDVVLYFSINNFEAEIYNNCFLTVEIQDIWEANISLQELGLFIESLPVILDTSSIKSGEYPLNCKIISEENAIISQNTFNIRIAPKLNISKMKLWHWPATVHYKALETSLEEAKAEVDRIAGLGFNWMQIRSDWAEKNQEHAAAIIDYALGYGIETGILIPNWKSGVFRMKGLPEECAIMKDNQETKAIANPFHPELIKRNTRDIEAMMRFFREFPACTHAFLNSELEDQLELSFSSKTKEYHEAELGFSLDKIKQKNRIFAHKIDDANYIKPGVINDDDPEYIYAKYYYKNGDGWVATNNSINDLIKEFRPDIKTIADPFRVCSIYDRFKGIDYVSSWTYTTPDPKMMLYTESLLTEAEPDNKSVLQTITFYNYGGKIMPSGNNPKERRQVICMGPDRFSECAWLNLSRAPDGIGFYFSSLLELAIEDGDPFTYSPETKNAIRKFNKSVIAPMEPVLKHLKNSKRHIAVLDSFSSQVYGCSPKPTSHYASYTIYDFFILMNMAHISADIIFDETVEKDGLDQYDCLFLPCCDTLTESVYNTISAFVERGGVVIADQWLRAEIPNVIRVDFDFTYRKNINANAICNGLAFDSNEDTAFKATWDMSKAEGVTAEDDRNIMEAYCQELLESVGPVINRNIYCSSPRALLNQLEYGDIMYLMVVNDNRTYGERLGDYKAILEKGVPLSVTITWDNIPENSILYNYITQEVIETVRTNTGIEFNLDLPAAGGAFIGVLNGHICQPEVSFPDTITTAGGAAKLEVGLKNSENTIMNGIVPVSVEFTDPSGCRNEFSCYTAAINGQFECQFVPAVNDQKGIWEINVRELASGRETNHKFELQ